MQAADKLAALQETANKAAADHQQHVAATAAESKASEAAVSEAQAQLNAATQQAKDLQGRLSAAQQQCSDEQEAVKQLRQAQAQQAKAAQADRTRHDSELAAAKDTLQAVQRDAKATAERLQQSLRESTDAASAAQSKARAELQQAQASLCREMQAGREMQEELRESAEHACKLEARLQMTRDAHDQQEQALHDTQQELASVHSQLKEKSAPLQLKHHVTLALHFCLGLALCLSSFATCEQHCYSPLAGLKLLSVWLLCSCITSASTPACLAFSFLASHALTAQMRCAGRLLAQISVAATQPKGTDSLPPGSLGLPPYSKPRSERTSPSAKAPSSLGLPPYSHPRGERVSPAAKARRASPATLPSWQEEAQAATEAQLSDDEAQRPKQRNTRRNVCPAPCLPNPWLPCSCSDTRLDLPSAMRQLTVQPQRRSAQSKTSPGATSVPCSLWLLTCTSTA